MSCVVPIIQLSSLQIEQIKTLLHFQSPVISKHQRSVPPAIRFYVRHQDHIYLPFLFTSSLLQIVPNGELIYPERSINFIGTLRDYQIPVQEEAWEQIQTYGTTILGLYPGFGKTALSSYFVSRLQGLTVVLLPREILIKQWLKTFQDNITARVAVVGVDSFTEDIDILICMDTRVNKIPIEIRKTVKVLIIDEAHMLCTPERVNTLLAFHPQYVIALSATLERDDENHRMIHAMCGEHGVFRQSTKPFQVVKILTGVKPERQSNKGVLDWAHLVLTTLMSERRNHLILHLIRQENDRKILILTSRTDHAKYLCDFLNSTQIPADYMCGRKGSYDDVGVVIGTFYKIGTGFDPATSCANYQGRPFDLLILVCSMKKYDMLTQNIGRVFRSESPKVLHLVDDDGIYQDHWRKAQRWYKLRGAEISVLDYRQWEEPSSEV